MNEKTYRFWTTFCLILAVASAFLFDEAGHLSWLVGVVGIAAAVVSACIYFYNSSSDADSKQKDLQPVVSIAREYIVATEEADHEHIDAEYIDAEIREGRILNDAQLSFWSLKVPHIDISKENLLVFVDEWPGSLGANYWRAVPRQEIQPKQFVNEVVEIVQRLSKTCEFELNMHGGGLVIRPRLTQGAEPFTHSAEPQHGDQRETIH